MSHNPLFQVMFSFHDSELPNLKLGNISGQVEYKGNLSAKFDLDVVVMRASPKYREDDRWRE